MAPWMTNPYRIGQRVLHALINDRLLQVASSLAFTTILAIVPLLAVTLGMMTAFPVFSDFEAALQAFLRQELLPPAFSETIMRYLDDFVRKASRLSAIGGLFLVVTAILVILSIDDALNDIWHVKRRRRVSQRLLIYWAVLSLGPIILGASLWASTFVAHEALGLGDRVVMPLQHLSSWLPFAIGAVGSALLFVTVPNCRVKLGHAAVGGIITATCLEMIKWGLGIYFSNIHTYTVIYGAFSVLPAFLLWVYLSWLALLVGAVATANLPNPEEDNRFYVHLHDDTTSTGT